MGKDAAGFWKPAISKAAGPVYLAIADALAADIASGELPGGTRLPPQRTLADALDIDFTTVSRAYAEARRRGLVDARVGQGTFVRRRRTASSGGSASGRVDMSMNLPPRFDDPGLAARMWGGIGALEATGGLELLLRYQEPGGATEDRAAGVRWLSPRIPAIAPENLLVCPGAQSGMLAAISILTAPGDLVCTDRLTYPGFRSLAAYLRIEVAGLATDAEGILPDSFEEACRARLPKALYCTPTLQNPTAATMSLARRQAIIAVARRHGVPIIEDDPYSALLPGSPPPLAALAPELVFHVAGLAKCLAPALRIAYLAAPDARSAARLTGAIRAAAVASPLTAAVATRWIQDGTAQDVLTAIRLETAERRAIAAAILPPGYVPREPGGFHLWLTLPTPWTRGEFTARLRSTGISVVASDVFALSTPPEAVRLGLGAAMTREDLAQSLSTVADLLAESPALSSMVI